jgi:hypothetical protein
MTHPTLLERLEYESESENNERKKRWSKMLLLSSQHFKGKGACWNFGMGIKTNNKWVNYSHKPAQTKQQVI